MFSIPADNYKQARQWATLDQDLNQARDFIRELRENDYPEFLGKNCGIVLDYVLRVMQCSKDATFFASRDRIALETGIPEKTAEYNIKKIIRLGIVKAQTFKSDRNPNYRRQCLVINPEFRKKFLKQIGKKISGSGNCPQSEVTPKQDKGEISSVLSSSSFSSLPSYSVALGVFTGAWGVRLGVYPTFGKKLSIYDENISYRSLNFSQKINYLQNHIETSGGGWAVRIPKGYMMIDCDSKSSFEENLMQYYHGGFIVKSPRGGKILVKHSGKVPKSVGDVEYHGCGKFAVVAGEGYEFMALSEPCNFIPESNLNKSGTIAKKRKEYSFSGKVLKGMRNDYLFRLGRSLKCQKFGLDSISQILIETNKKFDEPLLLSEVVYLAKHCVKYKNRQGFRDLST